MKVVGVFAVVVSFAEAKCPCGVTGTWQAGGGRPLDCQGQDDSYCNVQRPTTPICTEVYYVQDDTCDAHEQDSCATGGVRTGKFSSDCKTITWSSGTDKQWQLVHSTGVEELESTAAGSSDVDAPPVGNCNYYCHKTAEACSNCKQGQCTHYDMRYCSVMATEIDFMMLHMEKNATDLGAPNCKYHCHTTMANCESCWGAQGGCHAQSDTWCAKAPSEELKSTALVASATDSGCKVNVRLFTRGEYAFDCLGDSDSSETYDCGKCHDARQHSCSGNTMTTIKWDSDDCTGHAETWTKPLNECTEWNSKKDAVITCSGADEYKNTVI